MKKYYLHNGNEQQGPFDIEDLKTKNILKETPIWYDGLSQWTTAEQVDELKELFAQSPPPFQPVVSSVPSLDKKADVQKLPLESAKASNSKRAFLYFILFVVVFIIAFAIFYNSHSDSESNYKASEGATYKEKVLTVEEEERSKPNVFLSVGGNYNPNFWGDKLKVHGVITNVATVATYKDAVIKITYYSATKTALGTKEYTVYDYFPAHSERKFELKIDNYKDVNSIGLEVVTATAN